MLYHYGAAFTQRAHFPRFVTHFLNHGNFGVSLFFILSGFILFYTYAGNLNTSREVYKFFVARFCRIYPVAILAAALMAIALNKLPHGRDLLYFTMLQSWTPAISSGGYAWIMQGWTLSVELFFYASFPLLLPLVMRLSPSTLRWGLITILALTIGMLRLSIQHAGMDPGFLGSIFLPFLRTPEFVLGMLLGAVCLQRSDQKTPPHNDWMTFAGILPPIAIVSSTSNDIVLCCACVFWFSWMIYRLANGRGWLTAFLSSPLILLLGGASYCIYLMQSPIREGLRRVLAHHGGLDGALSPFVLITFSCLVFLFYEEPLRNRLRKLLTLPPRESD